MAKSVEEAVEDHYKRLFTEMGIKFYTKNEAINEQIEEALEKAESKSGGEGKNFPDIKLMLDCGNNREIPVMIEAKGQKGRLEKIDKDGQIVLVRPYSQDSAQHAKGDSDRRAILNYAVNGALHYGNIIYKNTGYKELIIIGINGESDKAKKIKNIEHKAYYISDSTSGLPKHIKVLDNNLALLKKDALNDLCAYLDTIHLTEEEIRARKMIVEEGLEKNIKLIHDYMYKDLGLNELLDTTQKLYLFCGLVIAGLEAEEMKVLTPDKLEGNNSDDENDGTVIIGRIKAFLEKKAYPKDKKEMLVSRLSPIFRNKMLWRKQDAEESVIKRLFRKIHNLILPFFEYKLHLDLGGKILNALSDWLPVSNDLENDVVLTPKMVTELMAKLARVNKDSYVWDSAMGSGGFLVSALELMIKDAQKHAKEMGLPTSSLAEKLKHINEKQVLGIEILDNVYILALLNMIIMGNESTANLLHGDSHEIKIINSPLLENMSDNSFPANVFLLNPPYSAPGKGLIFVKEALEQMKGGYAAVLIQENAGSDQGDGYGKEILKTNTLRASIKMNKDLFKGKSNVQSAIYLFEVNREHKPDDEVIFIDFSNDGFRRQNKKHSSQSVNLRDVDHAAERYAEIAAKLTGQKASTNYYNEENGLLIKDSISLNGNDWTFTQHQKVAIPTDLDFKNAVSEYMAWKFSHFIKKQAYDSAS